MQNEFAQKQENINKLKRARNDMLKQIEGTNIEIKSISNRFRKQNAENNKLRKQSKQFHRQCSKLKLIKQSITNLRPHISQIRKELRFEPILSLFDELLNKLQHRGKDKKIPKKMKNKMMKKFIKIQNLQKKRDRRTRDCEESISDDLSKCVLNTKNQLDDEDMIDSPMHEVETDEFQKNLDEYIRRAQQNRTSVVDAEELSEMKRLSVAQRINHLRQNMDGINAKHSFFHRSPPKKRRKVKIKYKQYSSLTDL